MNPFAYLVDGRLQPLATDTETIFDEGRLSDQELRDCVSLYVIREATTSTR